MSFIVLPKGSPGVPGHPGRDGSKGEKGSPHYLTHINYFKIRSSMVLNYKVVN